jgi:hypothetical protein
MLEGTIGVADPTDTTPAVVFRADKWDGGTGTVALADAETAFQFWNRSTTNLLTIKGSGNVGIGTTTPDRLLHAESADAVTNAVTYAQRLSHITSGTAAANFGVGTEFELEDANGTNRVAAYIEALWNDPATDAWKSDLLLKATDSGGTREIVRGRANGSAAAIGFLGATPAARIAHVADASVAYAAGDLDSEAKIITALNTTNGKINSILATLETFGFHATS